MVDAQTMSCLRIFETRSYSSARGGKGSHSSGERIRVAADGFLQMLEDGRGADVMFTCKDGVVTAHSCILVSKNSFFRTLFETGVGDCKSLANVNLASVAVQTQPCPPLRVREEIPARRR